MMQKSSLFQLSLKYSRKPMASICRQAVVGGEGGSTQSQHLQAGSSRQAVAMEGGEGEGGGQGGQDCVSVCVCVCVCACVWVGGGGEGGALRCGDR